MRAFSQADRFRAAGKARLFMVSALVSLLAACAGGPQDNISLIPDRLDQETSLEGLFTQAVKYERQRPGCSGECPQLAVDSLVFPGVPRLTQLVDHALAGMTWLDAGQATPYDDISSYEAYFWQTAAPRDRTELLARTRYRNRAITVLELNVGMYQTGMAHGLTGNQLINWDNAAGRALNIDELLLDGALPEFETALREAHAKWLQQSPFAADDPGNYARMWPFVMTDNVGLTDMGLLVKYQSYEIAPYAAGQPELLIPYRRLHGILRPSYLPAD